MDCGYNDNSVNIQGFKESRVDTMITKTDKLTYKVPENSAKKDAQPEGTKVTVEFDFDYCESADEAAKVAESKNWTLLEFVNDTLKQNARANKYQNEMALHKPSDVTPEEIKARMVRDFIRLGLPEDVARAQVESVLAANNG